MLQQDSQIIYELITPVVTYLNELLSKIVPGMEIYLVLVIAFTFAYAAKSKNNWNRLSFILFGLLVFGGLRYIGMGG